MTVFWIACGAVLAGTLLLLVPPLFQGREGGAAGDANLGIHLETLAEIERARDAGSIGAAEYAHARDILLRRVMRERVALATADAATAPRLVAWIVAVGICGAATALYAAIGTPAAIDPGATIVSPGAGGALPPDVQRRVARLAERLRESPNDADGWLMMGRSYVALGRFRDASIAYSRAAALRPSDANLAADHADVAAMAQGRRFAGEPARLIDHALALDPNHLKALALAGTAAMELRDYRAAADYWSRLLARVPADSPAAANARASLALAQALAGEGRP